MDEMNEETYACGCPYTGTLFGWTLFCPTHAATRRIAADDTAARLKALEERVEKLERRCDENGIYA